MKERFTGAVGRRLLISSLKDQKVVAGSTDAAEAIAEAAEIIELTPDSVVTTEGGSDNDVYFVLSGSVSVHVKGKRVASRSACEHVGEMAAIDPAAARSATIIAEQLSVLVKLPEEKLTEIADKFPFIWRNLAKELAHRLRQRNVLIHRANDQPRIFIMCSSEALAIAQDVQSALSHSFMVVVWTNGVFFTSGYPLDSLEEAVDESDFAIAIAQPDDMTESRGSSERSPRDNVIFELGLFMGRLGRQRTILLQPSGAGIKLPSDLSGLTPVFYRTGDSKDMPVLLAPACTEIRRHVQRLGVRS